MSKIHDRALRQMIKRQKKRLPDAANDPRIKIQVRFHPKEDEEEAMEEKEVPRDTAVKHNK